MEGEGFASLPGSLVRCNGHDVGTAGVVRSAARRRGRRNSLVGRWDRQTVDIRVHNGVADAYRLAARLLI